VDRGTDHDLDSARFLSEGLAWPVQPSIVGNGNDGRLSTLSEAGASGIVAMAGSGWHSCPFGEHDNPIASGKGIGALLEKLLAGAAAGAAIDSDWAIGRKAPAEKWHPKQFSLEHPALAEG